MIQLSKNNPCQLQGSTMEVREAIYNRRAIKQFDADHRMTAAEEKELFEATIQAPTSFNIQHWRFVILRDPDLRVRIRKEFGNDQAQMTDRIKGVRPL